MADAMTVERLLRFLAGRGHELDLVCFVESAEAEPELRRALGDVCGRIETVRLPKWRSHASDGRGITYEVRGPFRSMRRRSFEPLPARAVSAKAEKPFFRFPGVAHGALRSARGRS